jgi:GT2 family glycosyltransferase
VLEKRFTVTANQFCYRSSFALVGGFMTGVSEDVEWSHRAQKAGLTLGYEDSAVVDHPARTTWKELEAKWRRVDSETFQLHLLYKRSRITWLIRCLALPFSSVVHTPKLLMFKKLPFLTRLRGVWTLFHVRLWRSGNCLRLLRASLEPAG